MKNFIKTILIIIGLFVAGSISAASLLYPFQGGTGIGSYVAGDILYSNDTDTLTVLNCSDDQIVKWSGGVPACAADASGAGGGSGQWSTTTEGIYYDGMVWIGNIASSSAEFLFDEATGDLTITGGVTANTTSTFNGYVSIGTTTAPTYALDVVGSVRTNDTFYGDNWVSASGNSMNIQPTGDLDDYFSFKTPAHRPTMKVEGGNRIYVESSDSDEVGIEYRKDASHSGAIIYYKNEELFGLTSQDSMVFKVCGDYDNYVTICSSSSIPELSVASSTAFKINAGGTNALLLNHDGGSVAIGTTTAAYSLSLDTGLTFGIGSTQWNTGDSIDGEKIANDTIDDDSIDLADITLADFTNDGNYATTGVATLSSLTWVGTIATGTWNGTAIGNTWIASSTEFLVDNDTTYVSSDFTHDDLTGFVANEHLDWTADQGATDIHAGNYTTLTDLTDFDQTAWRLFYSNNLGDVIELSLGTDGQYLQSQGGTASLTWSVPTDTNTTYLGGTNLTLVDTTFNVDDAFLKNDANDTMTGTLTADGLTLGANENITLGSNTLDHDGTDFVFNDSVKASTAFIIGSASMSEVDLEKLDGITNGTAAANKALVLDASLDIATINSLTATTLVGALTGNADTATALASNGANATSGWAIIGVDASGAYEGGFDAWTEAENTAASYISASALTNYMQDEDINTFAELQSWVADETLAKLATTTDTKYCVWDAAEGDIKCTEEGGSGYTNLTSFVSQTAWRLFYSNIAGDVTELALGADNTYLMSNGAAAAPTFESISAGGTFEYDSATSTAAQTDFNLNFTYNVGADELEVYCNGLRMRIADDYTEASSTAIAFVSGRNDGDKLIFAVSGGAATTTGDVSDVFDCATGDCNTLTVGTSEWLIYGTGFIDANRFAGVTTVDGTEFGYLNGVTSAIQTQLDAKEGTLTNSAGLLAALSDETGTGVAVFSTSPTFTTGVTVPDNSISAAELNEGDNFAFTGTTVSLSGVTNFTVPAVADAAGEIAIDTTNDDQFIYYGDEANVITAYHEKCFTDMNATTSHDNIGLWAPHRAIEVTDMYCWVDAGTSIEITLSDGTNNLDTMTCTTAGASDDGTIANSTFTANEKMEYDTGVFVGAATRVTFCLTYKTTAD